MTSNKTYLPSILKNAKSQQNLQKNLQKDLLQKKQNKKFTKINIIDEQTPYQKSHQNIQSLHKLKSRSLANLNTKLRLQKNKKLSKIHDKNTQKQPTQNCRSSRNSYELSPQHSSNQSPRNKQKRFHINNLNLHTPQIQSEGVTKRTYVLKLLQNHDQVMPRSKSRKNSVVNLMQVDSISLKKSAINFYPDDNIIARSITFSHPQQLLLKKIMGKMRRQENEKKPMRKQWQQNKISGQSIRQKLKRQIIDGWNIRKQNQPNIFSMGSEDFLEV